MDEHATIFYNAMRDRYMLCTDEDFEQLPEALSRFADKAVFKKAFTCVPYKTGHGTSTEACCLIVYNPVSTAYGRRADGMVERLVAMNSSWIDRMTWKFEMLFPSGLPVESVLKYKRPEILY